MWYAVPRDTAVLASVIRLSLSFVLGAATAQVDFKGVWKIRCR